MKKTLLFVYPEMLLGGSTTSLLSLLNLIDYDRYEVDLLLFNNRGPYLRYLPKDVRLLAQANVYLHNSKIEQIRKVIRCILNGSIFKAFVKTVKYKKKFKPDKQALAYLMAGISRKISKEYDVAIGYLEYWPNAYVSKYIKAKKKIGWIHTDYEAAGLMPEFDSQCFRELNNIVLVSQQCKESFIRKFPFLESKCTVIENIMSQSYIEKRSNDGDLLLNKFTNRMVNELIIITVCRLTIDVKGIDRAISITRRLLDEGYKFKWFVLGEGKDRIKIEKMINKNNIHDNFVLLGQQLNPYPYIKNADIFCLPSRYEGKPIAVTEALMLDIPVIITNYSSAIQQIQHNFDGIISENNEEGLYDALKYILDNRAALKTLKKNIKLKSYDNINEIMRFYTLLGE